MISKHQSEPIEERMVLTRKILRDSLHVPILKFETSILEVCMRKKPNVEVQMTHDDIRSAMDKFLKKGGHITVLPQQRVTTIVPIGAEKWDAYEAIQDLNI